MMLGCKSASNPMAEDMTQVRISEKNQFALEMDHMADCVIHDRTPHTPGEEGLQGQKLMALIYKAAETRETIILPPVTKLDSTRGPAPRMLK